MNRRSFLLSGVAAVVAIGGYGAWTRLNGGNAPSLGSTLIEPGAAHAQTTEGQVDTSRVTEMVINPDAEVTLMEFASFTCPHCANFHATVWPQLKAEYIDTGLVKFVYREVYFDAYGLWAALVARCGGEMRYFGIVDMLYDEQREWAQGDDPNVVADNLRRIGRRAGMTDEQLSECLTDRDLATAMMQVYQEGMTEYDVTGTPSFVIDGTTYSNMSMDEFRAILDPLLNRG
ncbi:DsbA family protein [Pararhodobacter zhoushanensis]|jgi:protein-disulfide isomerase|uniref:DsbA family protein n=1 Tax=Pararhodobacter zhoushanensis TaxID=2479545 RepID=A0ABT3GUC7_9RHOB|nr:DsbA family protein [Pararhodobacter zhoushanensis]MCW1931131.1 DsbA family protein [Pararhodobacter zhoushanensis]